MRIENSKTQDSAKIVEIISRSIKELCFDDHQNDPDILNRWLQNKTTDTVEQWINANNNYCVSAFDDTGELAGFCMIAYDGEIYLLYVSPDKKGSGAGRALLQRMEDFALSQGVTQINLDSTNSALNFYKHHGYQNQGTCDARLDGMSCNRMFKKLSN